MLVTEISIDSRYCEMDPMNIVHHAVYATWYEIARMDYFDKAGLPYAMTIKKGINPPMVNLNVNFFATISYPETVTIRTHCIAFGPKKIKLHYEIINQSGQVVNTADTFHIWTGPNNKSIDLKANEPEIYNSIKNAAGADKETL